MGATSGRMMPKKICAWVAPSTFADSSRSFGIVSKKALHQPGVHAERAAEVEDDQRPRGVEADAPGRTGPGRHRARADAAAGTLLRRASAPVEIAVGLTGGWPPAPLYR